MKLPRWLTGLLIVASSGAVLGAIGLWLALPYCTGHRVLGLLADGNFEDANAYLTGPKFRKDDGKNEIVFPQKCIHLVDSPEGWARVFRDDKRRWEIPSLGDIVIGRRRFFLGENEFLTGEVLRGEVHLSL